MVRLGDVGGNSLALADGVELLDGVRVGVEALTNSVVSHLVVQLHASVEGTIVGRALAVAHSPGL